MFPARHTGPPSQPGQPPYKTMSIVDLCERIKEEYSFLQNQCHTLRTELDKLVSEKTDMQRHYVMYYEMSYGLNVEMHKQTEIAKRLNTLIGQILPYLSAEHQAQVAQAAERAKQVTSNELNAIIGQQHSNITHLMQLPQAHGVGPQMPLLSQLPPHLAGLQPQSSAAAVVAAGLPPNSAAAGLLALSNAGLAGNNNPLSHLASAASSPLLNKDSIRDKIDKRSSSLDERQRSSFSPSSQRDRHRSRSPSEGEVNHKPKKRNPEKSENGSDDERDDGDGGSSLIVDVTGNEEPVSPHNGDTSPRENGSDSARIKRETRPPSRSGSSSSSSTPLSSKPKEHLVMFQVFMFSFYLSSHASKRFTNNLFSLTHLVLGFFWVVYI